MFVLLRQSSPTRSLIPSSRNNFEQSPSLSSSSSSPTSSAFLDYSLTPLTPTFFWPEDYSRHGSVLATFPLSYPYTSMIELERDFTKIFTEQSPYNSWSLPAVPIRFKVYYLPGGNSIPARSIIHTQKRQHGFFKHPVLVVYADEMYAHFYAMTRQPPHAIAELGMCMKIGTTQEEEGLDTLKLQAGSHPMQLESWINLEQCFKIESCLLQGWGHNVTIAESEWVKLQWKIDYLEAQQNRFIYKPIARDLSQVRNGAIVLMPNPQGSPTFGAPVVVLENRYPHFRFLRVKSIAENTIFQEPRSEKFARARRNCLAITPTLQYGHDGTPVLILEPWSPDLREKSYVEISRNPRWGRLDKCQTWSWPPVVIQMHSIKVLYDYIAMLPPPTKGPRARRQDHKGDEAQPESNPKPVQPNFRHNKVARTSEEYANFGGITMYGGMYGELSGDLHDYINDGYHCNNRDAYTSTSMHSYGEPVQTDMLSSQGSVNEPVLILP